MIELERGLAALELRRRREAAKAKADAIVVAFPNPTEAQRQKLIARAEAAEEWDDEATAYLEAAWQSRPIAELEAHFAAWEARKAVKMTPAMAEVADAEVAAQEQTVIKSEAVTGIAAEEVEEPPVIEAPPPIEPEEPQEEEPKGGLPAVVEQPRAPAKWDVAIEAMNEKHAIIDNYGGKTVIASWEPSAQNPEKMEVVFQTKDSFLLRYSNRTAQIDVPDGRGGLRSSTLPLGQYWLGHRGRRQHRGVTFQPNRPEVVNECLNLWQGWGVEAGPGDWSLIRQHIEEVIAGGNVERADYVIRWMAWSVQNPGRAAEVALVLIGEKGAGKGTVARCLERIFGAHAFQVSSREHVIDRFNGHLQDCILFIADEAYWGGDKRCIGRLQGMITEPTLSIERKGFDVIQVRNLLHILMLAEPGWVIPAGRHERRYAAFNVSDARRGDRGYFNSLHRQIEHGGAEAMLWDLRGIELGDWHPRQIPEALLTGEALQKQQGLSLPPLEQWYRELLHNGALPGALARRPNAALTQSLLDSAWAGSARLRNDLTAERLGSFLRDEVGCEKHRTPSANGWAFPPLGECRAEWERHYGPIKWDLAEIEEWGQK